MPYPQSFVTSYIACIVLSKFKKYKGYCVINWKNAKCRALHPIYVISLLIIIDVISLRYRFVVNTGFWYYINKYI